jgi:hypothetical protein
MFNEQLPQTADYQMEAQQKLKESLSLYLNLPERLQNQDASLPEKLGDFLVDKGLIRGVDVWKNSWGFKYEDGKVYISEKEMSEEQYQHYIFRLGIDQETQEMLFPQPEEMDQYRFLHETSHAYQEYLTNKESPGNPDQWYTKVMNNEIDSNYAILWNYCFEKRQQGDKGLSTLGNVPDYSSIQNQLSQSAVRAIEDANELVTMYLWHPQYLETFLDYISGNKNGYGDSDLDNDGLTKISNNEKENLLLLMQTYVNEMKAEISG